MFYQAGELSYEEVISMLVCYMQHVRVFWVRLLRYSSDVFCIHMYEAAGSIDTDVFDVFLLMAFFPMLFSRLKFQIGFLHRKGSNPRAPETFCPLFTNSCGVSAHCP